MESLDLIGCATCASIVPLVPSFNFYIFFCRIFRKDSQTLFCNLIKVQKGKKALWSGRLQILKRHFWAISTKWHFRIASQSLRAAQLFEMKQLDLHSCFMTFLFTNNLWVMSSVFQKGFCEKAAIFFVAQKIRSEKLINQYLHCFWFRNDNASNNHFSSLIEVTLLTN